MHVIVNHLILGLLFFAIMIPIAILLSPEFDETDK